MKKLIFATLIVFVFAFGLVMNSFAEQPRYGGTLRVVSSMGPRSFYFPEGGPTDLSAQFPGIEALQMYHGRDLVPQLAESVDLDPDALTLTFHLKKGIKFHDGSELDADNVIWGINFAKEKGRLMDAKRLKSIEKIDDYTVLLHLTEYTNMVIHNLGWGFQYSKQQYTTHDVDYLRTNFVGTGPFTMAEWKRDSYMIWKKNPNYWRKGRPYLDGVEFRYVPEPVTSANMLEAGEVDMWINVPAEFQARLEKKGFIRNFGYGALPAMIYFNTTDPQKPTGNTKVRQAIEYAIDKPAIAKAIGFGYYEPLKMTAPKGEWGYDPDYPGRPYNPEKARRLLAEAGYPKGVKLELLAFATIGGGTAAAEAIKAYLGDVGIEVKLDLADPGRYWGSVFGTGWKDMVLCFTGTDPTNLITIMRWFSHEPATNLASYKRSPEMAALCEQALVTRDEAGQKAMAEKIIRLIADEASMIPLWKGPAADMLAPYVHTTYRQDGFINWRIYDDWMEKH